MLEVKSVFYSNLISVNFEFFLYFYSFGYSLQSEDAMLFH